MLKPTLLAITVLCLFCVEASAHSYHGGHHRYRAHAWCGSYLSRYTLANRTDASPSQARGRERATTLVAPGSESWSFGRITLESSLARLRTANGSSTVVTMVVSFVRGHDRCPAQSHSGAFDTAIRHNTI